MQPKRLAVFFFSYLLFLPALAGTGAGGLTGIDAGGTAGIDAGGTEGIDAGGLLGIDAGGTDFNAVNDQRYGARYTLQMDR